MERLSQIESMCERMYKSTDSNERSVAEQALQVFSVNAECIPECQFILDNSTSPYAQLMASSSLLKQATSHALTSELKINIRNYILTFLASKGPGIQPFVANSLILLLCRLIKLGWLISLSDDTQRDLIKKIKAFLEQDSADFYYLGLKIMNQLVTEMSLPTPNLPSTQHRKILTAFKDKVLDEIFRMSLSCLQHLESTTGGGEEKLRDQSLQLALKCFSFDFSGVSQDESSDDMNIIQVPMTWQPTLEDSKTMKIFFDYYRATKPPLSNQALECLFKLSSVRRSVFSNEQKRIQFLTDLMTGTKEILIGQIGLSEHKNYHEFCRLIGRFKNNYQIAELVNIDCYAEWIQLVAEFTVRSLQSWQWASDGVFFLLSLWARLVSSASYMKTGPSSMLETIIPKLSEVYITTRLESVQAVVQSQLEEDPLDNESQLSSQFESLPFLFRYDNTKTSLFIVNCFEPLLQAYQEASKVATIAESSEVQIVEGQLTWLVHIVSSIVKSKSSSTASNELVETLDGDISARVFELVKTTDSGSLVQRYSQESKQRMDLAILSFFQNFRKTYIGETAMHSSKIIYARLSSLMGIQDHLTVLNMIVTKIATNLKCYSKSPKVIEESLMLFQELAGGYMSGKMLLKLDAVAFFLQNHTREHFPFLDEFENSRNRTIFYCTLGRLLFLDESPRKFKLFVAPLQQVLVNLSSIPSPSFRTPTVKVTIIGLMRDLRGLTQATNSRRHFTLLFDWLYPALDSLFSRTLEHWADSPEVTTPALKLMEDFAHNKNQRLSFDSSSPNGILLFREISKLVIGYGTRILQIPPSGDLYLSKYKGIWVCFSMLARAFVGNYVNFGVFELYGDRALVDALEVTFKLTQSIPLGDMLAYKKLSRAYFAFIEALTAHHIPSLANLDAPTFHQVVTSLDAGLRSLEVNISTQCANATDNLAAFFFNHVVSPEAPSPSSPAAQKLVMLISEFPSLFPTILSTLFDIVLFEECTNQWSLSRPMLSLILINERFVPEIKAQLINSQAASRYGKLSDAFDKLMADVSRSLDSKNRDRFTQNLAVFKHDFKAK